MSLGQRVADVQTLVVGAGVVGSAASFFLRAEGRDVLLVDMDMPGRGASGRNPGSLAIQNKPVVLVKMAMEAVRVWRFLQEMGDYDVGYHCVGGLRLAETEEEAGRLADVFRQQREQGAELEHLRGKAIRDIAPYLCPTRVLAANYSPGDGYGNPLVAVPEIVRAFTDLGGEVRSGIHVDALEEIGDRVVVKTNVGEFRAKDVLVAAGAKARALLQTTGFDLPVEVRAMQLMVTEPVPHFVPHMITHINGDLTLKQKLSDGTILIGGGWSAVPRSEGDFRADLLLDHLIGNAHGAARVIPRLRQIKIIRTWGAIDGKTPGLLPMLGRVPGRSRVWFSTTCTGGYTMGPLLGRSVAEAMMGQPAHETVAPYLHT